MKATHFLLLLIVLLVVVFFPLRILQFVTLLYIAVLAFSFVYARIISRYVTVRRKDRILRAHRFDPMEITLIVENRGPLPVAYLNLVDEQNHFFASEPGNFLISLHPGERKILRYSIESQQRGQYSVGPVLIQGSDPFWILLFRHAHSEGKNISSIVTVCPLFRIIKAFQEGLLGFMCQFGIFFFIGTFTKNTRNIGGDLSTTP